MINKKQSFQLSKEVLSQDIDDETILLDMKSEKYFEINDVGGRVLEILKSGANLSAIVDILLIEYDVERSQLEDDISELLQQFLDAGFIHPKT